MSDTREELEEKKMKLEILKMEKELGKIDFDIENSNLLRKMESMKFVVTAMTAISLGLYFIFSDNKRFHDLEWNMFTIWIVSFIEIMFFAIMFANTDDERKRNSREIRQALYTSETALELAFLTVAADVVIWLIHLSPSYIS